MREFHADFHWTRSVRKVSNLRAGTARSCREPYQESKEPGELQEFGFLPKKSESSVGNVLEHCRDGGTNFPLTTILVSCAAQHHLGDGGHPCSTLWLLFVPVARSRGVPHHGIQRKC